MLSFFLFHETFWADGSYYLQQEKYWNKREGSSL